MLRLELENRTMANIEMSNKAVRVLRFGPAHRQDKKGVRWMPWHQEQMKDVDGCDKPRRGAEQLLTRGSPNGETRHR